MADGVENDMSSLNEAGTRVDLDAARAAVAASVDGGDRDKNAEARFSRRVLSKVVESDGHWHYRAKGLCVQLPGAVRAVFAGQAWCGVTTAVRFAVSGDSVLGSSFRRKCDDKQCVKPDHWGVFGERDKTVWAVRSERVKARAEVRVAANKSVASEVFGLTRTLIDAATRLQRAGVDIRVTVGGDVLVGGDAAVER